MTLASILDVWIFIIGACVGSFMNVCIWRIPREESIVSPPSHCPGCGYQIAWFDNLPLFSWLILRGKCRKCARRISPRYFLVELLSGILFLVVWLKCGGVNNPASFIPAAFVLFLVVTTVFIDLEHMIIPDEITFTVMIAGVLLAFLFPFNWYAEFSFARAVHWVQSVRYPWLFSGIASILSMCVTYIIFYLFAVAGKKIFKREALGMGDVKYLAAVAAAIGFPAAFISVLLGSIMGSVYGISLLIGGKASMKTPVPFGPFLGAGTLIWLIFSSKILDLYLLLTRYLASMI